MTDEWQRQVENRLQSLELRSAVDEVHRTTVDKRLGSIEESLKWLVRLVFGALVMCAIGYALKGGFAVP